MLVLLLKRSGFILYKPANKENHRLYMGVCLNMFTWWEVNTCIHSIQWSEKWIPVLIKWISDEFRIKGYVRQGVAVFHSADNSRPVKSTKVKNTPMVSQQSSHTEAVSVPDKYVFNLLTSLGRFCERMACWKKKKQKTKQPLVSSKECTIPLLHNLILY